MAITSDHLEFLADPVVLKSCGPVFFTNSLKTPVGTIKANGSFGLVNTGKKQLLVTANHVWVEFVELKKADAGLMLGLCFQKTDKPIIFPHPEELLVDVDKRCDLATFDMEMAIRSSGGRLLSFFFDMQSNRPPEVHIGDVLYLIGYPGKGRGEEDNSVTFTNQRISVQASEVGKSHFYAKCTGIKWNAADYGGMSGCPCFVIREGRLPKLVGFTTAFVEQGKRLQISYAKRIKPDGMIDYML